MKSYLIRKATGSEPTIIELPKGSKGGNGILIEAETAPTVEQAQLLLAQAAKQKQIGGKLKTDLLAVFESFSEGDQLAYEGPRARFNEWLGAGELAKARQGLVDFPGATQAQKDALLAVLDPALAKLAAVQAATSLEQIQAI